MSYRETHRASIPAYRIRVRWDRIALSVATGAAFSVLGVWAVAIVTM